MDFLFTYRDIIHAYSSIEHLTYTHSRTHALVTDPSARLYRAVVSRQLLYHLNINSLFLNKPRYSQQIFSSLYTDAYI